MTDIQNDSPKVRNSTNGPQCQYYVTRKKRLCRMTVRPGRQYCGEHEPQPQTADGQDDTRIPCPNDPKHTVYVSKLEKHLSICNARATEQPVYIVPNINAPTEVDTCHRKPLSQLPWDTVMQVVDKVNFLYEKHVKGTITTAPDYPIHSAVMPEFAEGDRAESSLRHLRQVSSLLWLTEQEGLVADDTCYVELGAGKGHMSYYACGAWRRPALLVDRASLRHKRDNKLAGGAARIRADLAHLALDRVPLAPACRALVGLAKHLCGVATDYALRCMTGAGAASTRGLVLATCCHHRCERGAFVGNKQLEELGISGDEFNVMLGIVSWATCGDGRSRVARAGGGEAREGRLEAGARARAGRRAKRLVDWARVQWLRERGFAARLVYFVPPHVSPENVAIVATRPLHT
ncbi:tRNA:m(4)X modification enzyme TRM13 homolog [Helicoverpa armigera]|uniref:tRNA:m(4)X modification enzyme TRM13 homolog n=1 Tax=Helicoverpa armigera TaxID=29058 RepID=UPI00308382B9